MNTRTYEQDPNFKTADALLKSLSAQLGNEVDGKNLKKALHVQAQSPARDLLLRLHANALCSRANFLLAADAGTKKQQHAQSSKHNPGKAARSFRELRGRLRFCVRRIQIPVLRSSVRSERREPRPESV